MSSATRSRLLSAIILSATLQLFTVCGQAATIILKDGSVSGIQGLTVGAATYDVLFYETGAPDREPRINGFSFREFEGNKKGANAAATAILDLLNMQNPIPQYVYAPATVGTETFKTSEFWVFYDDVMNGQSLEAFSYRSRFEDGKWIVRTICVKTSLIS
jgi:hypothetical protein